MNKQCVWHNLQGTQKYHTKSSRSRQVKSLREYQGRNASWKSVIITWVIAALTFGSFVAADKVREIRSQYLAAYDNAQAEVESDWLSR